MIETELGSSFEILLPSIIISSSSHIFFSITISLMSSIALAFSSRFFASIFVNSSKILFNFLFEESNSFVIVKAACFTFSIGVLRI